MANLVSSKGSLPSLQASHLLTMLHLGFAQCRETESEVSGVSSDKDTDFIRSGTHLYNFIESKVLIKGYFSKYSHIGELGLQHMNLGDTHTFIR